MLDTLQSITSNPDIAFHWRSVVGEFLATMIYVFLSTMSYTFSHPDDKPIPNADLISALGNILALVSVTHTFLPISGAHLNPAGLSDNMRSNIYVIVTISTMVTRNVGVVAGLLYIVAQILGGITGAAWTLLFAGKTNAHLGAFELSDTNQFLRGFGVEIMLTYIYVTVYFGVAIKATHLSEDTGLEPLTSLFAHVPIGYAMGACVMAGPLTGACINPARAFGPELVSWSWKSYSWIYYVGPLIGGFMAGIIFEFILTKPRRSYIRLK
jgi:glycerol uptake facilitator-like aquaporin